jgi:DNA gyrase subunit A
MEKQRDMKSIIEESFIQYSGAVLQSRALVDVRDCIKPSARQIFYCLYTDKFLPNKPFKKTLKAIGSIARMYIHGDASAEGVIMRAGQPFTMRYPLVEVEGNGGNPIESGNWAANRYTSSRLSPFAVKMFQSIDKGTIEEWRDNYDDTEKYPTVLPSKGYFNIVNGTFGIGIGASSSIPQFNIRDINTALITLLKNPDATFEDLYCRVDFASGGILINEPEVREALKNGHGASCKLRAKIEYNAKENTLVATEIPYGVYTNTICKELEAILESEDNPGIDKFNDLTNKTPLIEIYLKKNVNPTKVLNYLWKHTSLQSYFSINFTMLKDGRFPTVFTWKETLQEHINHEINVYKREFEFDLNKIKYQIMINEGILKCLPDIDNVVQMIKTSESTADAREKLMAAYDLNLEQASGVLKITLSRLARLEIVKLQDETEQLRKQQAEIEKILNDKELFNSYLIKGWEDTMNKYGDDYRTQIVTLPELTDEDKEVENVNAEDVVVIITKAGMVKRVPKSAFKPQTRNTKGIKTVDEAVLTTISTNTIDTLMIFTSTGKLYRLLVDMIPAGTAKSKGTDLASLAGMKVDEEIVAATSLDRHGRAKYVCFVTKQGLIKKTELKEYITGRRGAGVAAIKLKENDSIASVVFLDEEELLIATKNGMAIRFNTKTITPVGKTAMGVKGISLAADDYVITSIPIESYTPNIAVFTPDGRGKKIDIVTISLQNRGGKGAVISKTPVAAVIKINKDDNVFVQGRPTSICIAEKDIPLTSRVSIGNLMIKQSTITDVIKL